MSDKTDEQIEEERHEAERAQSHVEALEREHAFRASRGETDLASQVQAELERVRPSGGAKRSRLRGEKA